MKILITGASGNVGQFVTQELIKLNEEVVVGGTNVLKLKELFGQEVNSKLFDFQNPDTFDDVLEGVDRVYLMRPPHLGNPKDLFPFLERLKNYPIKHIVFLSLMGIENNRIPPHYKIEKKIETLSIPYTHIRPGFFMQNISGIHSVEIREKNEIFVPAGNSKTSFIDAMDIGYAISRILHEPVNHQNKAYTLTGLESLTYYDIAEILSGVTNREITYRKPSLLRYRNTYIHGRKLNKTYVNVTVALYLMTRMGTAKTITNDYKLITGQLPTTFREFCVKNKHLFTC